MKTIVPLKGILIALLALAVVLLLSFSLFASTSGNRVTTPNRDTIEIIKAQTNKKYRVRMYPNAQHTVIFFSASGQNGKVYQLYLFDLDGKLTKQTHIRNKETTVLTNIVKGNYTFEVFSDDERIENGVVTIK